MLRATLREVAPRAPRARKALAVIDVGVNPQLVLDESGPSLQYHIRVHAPDPKGELRTTVHCITLPPPLLPPCTTLAVALSAVIAKAPAPAG